MAGFTLGKHAIVTGALTLMSWVLIMTDLVCSGLPQINMINNILCLRYELPFYHQQHCNLSIKTRNGISSEGGDTGEPGRESGTANVIQ
jgi:hypothetical protein